MQCPMKRTMVNTCKYCHIVSFAHSKTIHFPYSVVSQSQTQDELLSTRFFFDFGLQNACCSSANLFIQNCSSVLFALKILPLPFRPRYCFELSFAVFISQMIFQLIHHSFSMKYDSSSESNRSLDLKKEIIKMIREITD